MFALIEITADMASRATLVAVTWFFTGFCLLLFFETANKWIGYIYSALWLIPPLLFGIFGAITFILLGT